MWKNYERESKGTTSSKGMFPLGETQDVNCENCYLIFSKWLCDLFYLHLIHTIGSIYHECSSRHF